MWARACELLLAAWMAASPFVLAASSRAQVLRDLAFAIAIALPALVSFHPKLGRAHLVGLPVATGLVLFGWVATRSDPASPAQNHLLVGLVLGMLAIVPSHASRPPRGWLEHEQGRGVR